MSSVPTFLLFYRFIRSGTLIIKATKMKGEVTKVVPKVTKLVSKHCLRSKKRFSHFVSSHKAEQMFWLK